MDGQTASTFLAKFLSITAGLEPDERIELAVYAHEGVELLKAVLSDSQANKICSLQWWYEGIEDVNLVLPLLINSCPELASLDVCFRHYSAFDFASSVLEHPSNKVKVLEVSTDIMGDIPRFFAALRQSQVSALTLSIGESPEFDQGLFEYLAKDLLVRLRMVVEHKRVPSEMMMSLAACTRLVKLEISYCEFSEWTAFALPKSITKLELEKCTFVGGFDWSFLADSNVRELDFAHVSRVNGNQLGDALAVYLRAKGLDKLRFFNCKFTNETLAVVGVEVGRIKRLDLEESDFNDASLEQIATALKSPNSELRELGLEYEGDTASGIENLLVPALRHPNCGLAKLRFWAFEPEHEAAAKRMENAFRNRRALFALLQGQRRRADQQEDMLSCCRRAARRDDRPLFAGESDKIMPRDEALERFDRLRVRKVRADDDQTAAAVLAEFQSIAASLKPDERIKLELLYTRDDVESIKAVLSDPQASKICSLRWDYFDKEDVDFVIPLLINNCPELASLELRFTEFSAFDFVSSLLEHPSNKLKVLEMLDHPEGDLARFFVALGQSQVSALILYYLPEFAQGLYKYLARDLLVRLEVGMDYKQVPQEVMMSLVKCTRLVELGMMRCKFSQPITFTHLPKSITKLELESCTFVGGFDWSFLSDSNVRELSLCSARGVDRNQFGGALAVQLRAKRLDRLRFYRCDFADETLIAAGAELGRIKRLDVVYSNLNDASVELIALALQSPNNELRELKLEYKNNTASSIENHLVPALRHLNCSLAKLSLWGSQTEHKEAAKAVEDTFRNRLALFALLQAQRVRRRYCLLRRLPVEMFRLVGQVLL